MNEFIQAKSLRPASARSACAAGKRIESAVLAMVLLLMAESMLFAGLLAACVLIRSRSLGMWPPVDLPRLPLPVTLTTTLTLLATVPLVSVGRQRRSFSLLFTAMILGGVFLIVHGTEWARMLAWHGVAGSYGAIFYSLVGVHALHVLGGLAALTWATCTLHHENSDLRLKVCGMYWFFVVAVWPVIYGLVYH